MNARLEAGRAEIKARLRAVLLHHTSPDAAIRMVALIPAVLGEHVIPWRRYDQSRLIRSLVEQLRREGLPVCIRGGSRDGGYFVSAAHAERTAAWFRKRAFSAFRQEAALRRISLRELFTQYELDLTQGDPA